MTTLQALEMRGGPHDGVHLDPSVRGPHPETLFLISFDDGTAYARAGQESRSATALGACASSFASTPTGSLTEHAKRRFTTLS